MLEKADSLLLQAEVADLLNVSPRTVEGWRYRKTGPPFVSLSRRIRYRPADILAYIARNTRKPLHSRNNP